MLTIRLETLAKVVDYFLVVEGDQKTLLADGTLEAYRALLEETLAEEPLVREVVSIVLEPTRGRKLEFALQPAELREALATEGLPEGAGAFLKVRTGGICCGPRCFRRRIRRMPARLWWSGCGQGSQGEFRRAFRRR